MLLTMVLLTMMLLVFFHFGTCTFDLNFLVCSLFQLKKDQTKHVFWISNMFNLVSPKKVIMCIDETIM